MNSQLQDVMREVELQINNIVDKKPDYVIDNWIEGDGWITVHCTGWKR